MNKQEAYELTTHMLVTDALIQLKAMRTLLIEKGLFSKEELNQAMESLTKKIAKSILQSAQVPGDLDTMIDAINKN